VGKDGGKEVAVIHGKLPAKRKGAIDTSNLGKPEVKEGEEDEELWKRGGQRSNLIRSPAGRC